MLEAFETPEDTLDVLRHAEEWIEGYFQDWEARIKRFVGPGYRSPDDDDPENFDPENFSYEWQAHDAAQLVLGNPRVRITTTRSGPEREVAKAHQLALNRWIHQTKMRQLNHKLVADFGFIRGVCLTLPSMHKGDPDSDYDDLRGWPSAKRVSPRRYIYDVLAIEKEEELWRGHKTIHQRRELAQMARERKEEFWDQQAIKNLVEGHMVDDLRPRGRERDATRDEVVLYNIWVRDYEPSDEDKERHGEDWERRHRYGAWLTLGVGGDQSEWVRPPYPYWGHRRGPYVIIDGLPIPDESLGLAPIPACQLENDELNVHARGISRAMRKYKRGIVVDGSDPDFADKIEAFSDHDVVGIDGLEDITKKLMQVELAGATEGHFTHLQICRERLKRKSGKPDTNRGIVDTNVTATADQLADQASATREGLIAQIVIEGFTEILENISLYLAYDKTKTRLGPEARRVLRDPNGKPAENTVYYGGIANDEEAAWFDSLSLMIEAYSTGSTDEALQQQRTLQLMNTIAVFVQMMPQAPFVLWDDLIETVGEMMNAPNLSDYFDFEALQAFQQLMLQGAEISATQGGTGKTQPRVQRDVSRMLRSEPEVALNGNMLGAFLAAGQR